MNYAETLANALAAYKNGLNLFKDSTFNLVNNGDITHEYAYFYFYIPHKDDNQLFFNLNINLINQEIKPKLYISLKTHKGFEKVIHTEDLSSDNGIIDAIRKIIFSKYGKEF